MPASIGERIGHCRRGAFTYPSRMVGSALSVSMRIRDGKPLPQALPGQYVVLRLRRTSGSSPLLRSYSLSGPPSTESYRARSPMDRSHSISRPVNRRSNFASRMTVAAGEAVECLSANAAVMRAEALSRKPGCAGAVAFSRSGDPATGEFGDATVIRKFGDVPNDLSAL